MAAGAGKGRADFFAWLADLVGRPRYLVYALLVHVAFFAVLVFSLEWTVTPAPPPAVNVIEAVAVDEARIQAEMEKLRRAEELKKQKAREAERKRRQEERRLAELRKKREAEQRRLREQERKRKAEARRLAELKKKKEAEQRRLAELKKKKEAEQRRLREEERRKEEAARLAALKREQEELERRRKEAEARKRREAELALQRQLVEEERRRADAIVSQYVEIIKQKVMRNWLRPSDSRSGLSCEVRVRLIPGGEVVEVQIVRSSGDSAFDASVEKAVLKSSPLPLPEDPALFERFRELKFIFKPED